MGGYTQSIAAYQALWAQRKKPAGMHPLCPSNHQTLPSLALGQGQRTPAGKQVCRGRPSSGPLTMPYKLSSNLSATLTLLTPGS